MTPPLPLPGCARRLARVAKLKSPKYSFRRLRTPVPDRSRKTARCADPARGHDGGLQCLRSGRRLDLQGRLRSLRGRRRPLLAQIRARHAQKGGQPGPLPSHAREARRTPALAHAPVGGKRGLPAIFHALRPWLSGKARRADYPKRSCARTLGRHRAFGHPRRGSRRKPPPQRARRNKARPAFRPVSTGAPKPLQRRADRRLSRSQARFLPPCS